MIGGLDLHFRDAGEGDRVVLFLHGFPFDSELWSDALATLPDGWRGIAPDLRGFGASAPGDSDVLTMERLARDVLALIDSLGIRTFVACGLSMGGYVAFRLQALAPERLTGLVLADTRAAADTEQARTGRRALAARIRGQGTESLADELVQKLLSPTTFRDRPDVVERLRTMMRRQSADTIARASLGMARRPDSTPLLRSIAVPSLVIAGGDDVIVPAAEAASMARAIPRAALCVVPAAGHVPVLERPTEFAAAVETLLRQVAASRPL